MPLKGSGEARGKPPRCRAWLRDRMVSSNEADLDLRGKAAPVSTPCPMGQSVSVRTYRRFVPRSTVAYLAMATRRMTWINLTYPMSTEKPTIVGIGRKDNRHLTDLVESITRNLGDLSADDKESGSSGLVTTPKTSEASEGSQRGHSSLSTGKPCTWRRATACRCFGSEIPE